MSFEIRVRPETPLGEYSVSIKADGGEKRTIIGGLTIEEFANPWIRSICHRKLTPRTFTQHNILLQNAF